VVAGGAIRFSSGDFQTGRNDCADELVTIAIGAPLETAEIRVPVACPACGTGLDRSRFADR
jgi:hypothetical protein